MHIAAAGTAPVPLPSPRRSRKRTPVLSERILRQYWGGALCLVVLLADQASKAVRPPGTFVVNTGGAAILPAAVGDTLWKSPTLGPICDCVDLALLLCGLLLTRKLPTSRRRAAGIAVLAGLLSNLADRLGATSLFHDSLPRGSIDWIPVPLWPAARTNVADVVIAIGAVALAYQPGRRVIHALRTYTGGMSNAADGSTPSQRICGYAQGRRTTRSLARTLAAVSPPITGVPAIARRTSRCRAHGHPCP